MTKESPSGGEFQVYHNKESMNIDRLLAHKAELRAQLNAELRYCRAKYRRWIDDVELQIKRLQKAQASNTTCRARREECFPRTRKHHPLKSSRNTDLLSLVRDLLVDLDNQPLTTKYLAQVIFHETGRRIAARKLAKPLSALAKARELVVLERASGHQPTLYARFRPDAARRSFVDETSAVRQDMFKSRPQGSLSKQT